jgi:phosphoribosyl 1,2-cyclic phosphodiesterase
MLNLKDAMRPALRITLWGVRGSIPSPGANTARYGGNTSCISIELGDDRTLILDGGTGIRLLGKALAQETQPKTHPIYILITHHHWDHIQGFPFFEPLFQPGRKIYLCPILRREELFCSLVEQVGGGHHPFSVNAAPSSLHIVTEDAMSFLAKEGFTISHIAANHPGGAFGYKIEHQGRVVIYMPDNELSPPYPKGSGFEDFVHFCNNADILIHDAQYVEEDMPIKRGWGHSLVTQTCELAGQAHVKHLILFHHDPDRSDTELDAICAKARTWFWQHYPSTRCTAAYEGLTVEL